MKRLLIGLIVALSAIALLLPGSSAPSSASLTQQIPKESKDQPKGEVDLDTDSQDDDWGKVAFNHEHHTLQANYNPDGQTVTTCITCHHTDQPKESLKSPLLTSKRDVALTPDVLKDAAAPPVKTCRACHLQTEDESNPLPKIPKDGKQVKMNNQNAYHFNCRGCHDKAITAKPELEKKIGGSGTETKVCAKCHVRK